MRRDAAVGAALRRQVSAISTAHFAPGLFSVARPTQPRLRPITIAALSQVSYFSTSSTKCADAGPALVRQSPKHPINHDAANPPASSRPPPLDLPTRDPETSYVKHLFHTGKAFLTFYKTGLRQLYTNTRIIYPSSSGPPAPPPLPGTRAAHIFRHRWEQDIRRLPLFLALLVVCGEFTPLAVVFFPNRVPLTCRIPSQVNQLRRKAEERRTLAIERYHHAGDNAQPGGYAAQALGITGPRMASYLGGLTLHEFWYGRRLWKRMNFLAKDDELLIEAGGVQALENDEVLLACEDRGIPIVERDIKTLRQVLKQWLLYAGKKEDSEPTRVQKMMEMVLSEEKQWPSLKDTV